LTISRRISITMFLIENPLKLKGMVREPCQLCNIH
jgi:hypothetical protein